jgi:hypothetical protein
MDRHFLFATVGVVLLACATQTSISSLPYCVESEEVRFLPDRSCQDDPDFIAFRNEIEQLVISQAGPLLVRITLDDDAKISDACAVRGYGSGQWTARTRLAGLLAPPATSLSGPSCAAGSSLEFNRAQATYELIRVIERDCERQSINPRQFAECLDMWQRRRGEIWVFGSNQRYRVFVPTREPSPRRTALLACTKRAPASGLDFQPIGIARVGVVLEECMRAEGWIELK